MNPGDTTLSNDNLLFCSTDLSDVRIQAERWKPEATYYTTFHGKRTAIIVFDLPNASAMLPFTEPFFAILNAEVLIAPAMSGDDLQNGLSADSQPANLPPVGSGRNPDVVHPPRGRRW